MTFLQYLKAAHSNDTPEKPSPESCKKLWGAFGYFISGITVVLLALFKQITGPLEFYLITSAALLGLETAKQILEAKFNKPTINPPKI